MSNEGFLAAFWADVGFVKLMSNFHTPESGQVLRRVMGKADKEERGAPTVGVDYNHFMGGTDLKDFVRGLYTTHRRGKKWWRCLYYWFLDTSMYNAFVLYRWFWCHLKDTNKCPMMYKGFIKEVTDHLLSWIPSPAGAAGVSVTTATPTSTPARSRTPTPTPRSATRKPRVTRHRNVKRKLKTNPYEGPGGETRPPLKRAVCVGADLCKTKKGGLTVRVSRNMLVCIASMRLTSLGSHVIVHGNVSCVTYPSTWGVTTDIIDGLMMSE